VTLASFSILDGNADDVPPDKEAGSWSILDAPDYADFVKIKETATSREYRDKTRSLLKAAAFGCLNSELYSDAAAIFERGPAFAKAVGNLADTNQQTRNILDIALAPESPWLTFAMVGIPLVAQILRNHEPELQAMPDRIRMTRKQRKAQKEQAATQGTVPVTVRMVKIPFTKRHVPIKIRFKIGGLLAGFRAQTTDPQTLQDKVFSNEDLMRALAKQGIVLVKHPHA
jgi:hypothetical protein